MASRQQQPEHPKQQEGTESLQPGEENEVTRPSDLGFGPKEIEVDPIMEVAPIKNTDDGYVEVRMAVTIEEFTYGNPHMHMPLEEGKRYRMPTHIAQYLQSLGKLSNIA